MTNGLAVLDHVNLNQIERDPLSPVSHHMSHASARDTPRISHLLAIVLLVPAPVLLKAFA